MRESPFLPSIHNFFNEASFSLAAFVHLPIYEDYLCGEESRNDLVSWESEWCVCLREGLERREVKHESGSSAFTTFCCRGQ